MKRKYKIGDKIVLKTTRQDAYYLNLLDRNELSYEEISIYSTAKWGDMKWWDSLVRFNKPIKFYGKVIDIKEGCYADKVPYREVYCLFSNGAKAGFLEDKPNGFRKANFLEEILFNFESNQFDVRKNTSVCCA